MIFIKDVYWILFSVVCIFVVEFFIVLIFFLSFLSELMFIKILFWVCEVVFIKCFKNIICGGSRLFVMFFIILWRGFL